MNAIKSTGIAALIFAVCASLSGTLFVLTASGQITPKEIGQPTKFYQIREGDTLGGLSKEYRSDKQLWRDFEKYNIFANPNVIYPCEELQVPASWPLARSRRGENKQEERVAREAMGLALETGNLIIENSATTVDFELFRAEFNSYRSHLHSSITQLRGQIADLRRQNEVLEGSIGELQNGTEINGGAVADWREAVESNEKRIVSLSKQVTLLQTGLHQNGAALRRWHDRTDALNSRVNSLAHDIGAIGHTQDKILAELQDFLQPASLDPSKKTRTFGTLTVLAGGAAWLAVNAARGRD